MSEDFERHTPIPRSLSFEQEQQANIGYDDDDDDEMSDPNLEKAATRIQASYRGYKTRKELGSTPIGSQTNPHHEQHYSQIQKNSRNKNSRIPLLSITSD